MANIRKISVAMGALPAKGDPVIVALSDTSPIMQLLNMSNVNRVVVETSDGVNQYDKFTGGAVATTPSSGTPLPSQDMSAAVVAAVTAYMADHPLPDGKTPTDQQVQDQVSAYMALHPVKNGVDGTNGTNGKDASSTQIANAIAAYFVTNSVVSKVRHGVVNTTTLTLASGAKSNVVVPIASGLTTAIDVQPVVSGALLGKVTSKVLSVSSDCLTATVELTATSTITLLSGTVMITAIGF